LWWAEPKEALARGCQVGRLVVPTAATVVVTATVVATTVITSAVVAPIIITAPESETE